MKLSGDSAIQVGKYEGSFDSGAAALLLLLQDDK
jgi:hypothetical protein